MRKLIFGVIILGAILFAGSFLASKAKHSVKMLGKSVTGLSWAGCDGLGDKVFKIEKITVKGDFSAGSTATFTVDGTALIDFVDYSHDIKTKYGIITAIDKNFPVNPPREFKKGPNSLTINMVLDSSPPNGGYTTQLTMRDGSNNKLQCVLVTYKIA